MAPRTPKQLEAFRAEKKLQIVRKTLVLFARKGYHNTSINDIAKTVGMSKGLLYSYFENKEALLNEVLEQSFIEATEYDFDLSKLAAMPPEQLIPFYFDHFFKLLVEKKELWQLIASLSFQVNSIPSAHQTIIKFYDAMLGQVKFLFTYLGFDDPEMEAHKLGAIVDGIGLQYLVYGEKLPLEKIKNHLIKTYLK
jgi:AcrR family transcriptional regulator